MNKKGEDAEQLAAVFLEKQGLAIIKSNWRGRFGEINLIAKEGATLVLVEVRGRRPNAFGGAAASISAAKQGRLTRTALQYLTSLKHTLSCRFEAVFHESTQHGRTEQRRI